jgi:predicted nucleotide-binding protein
MDLDIALPRLQHLKTIADRYSESMYTSSEENRALHQEICEVYGEVAEVYQGIVGRLDISVPPGNRGGSKFPNYFEAGFLSGRSFHTHEGKTELMKVIGTVKSRIAAGARVVYAPKASHGSGVFLVHGRDEAVLQTVARFLESLRLQITILREQPNRGRTVIEKFVDYSNVGFAVVLLTGDDVGELRDEPAEQQRPRARQNVIFELGFFLGKLGRDRVCALYQEGVEVPSDYTGVAFVMLDGRGAWKLELAREMKAAGLPIDMNQAI